jgi:hypothetical protein
VQLHFLGKETYKGGSPTLYDTDRNTYLVQGWKVTDPEDRARLALTAGQTCVEVPGKLMSYLTASQVTATDDAQPPMVIRTDKGTYLIKGQQVTDAEALGQLDMPDHETVVEVSSALRTVLEEQHAAVDA